MTMTELLMQNYKRLMEKDKDLTILQSAAAIVNWDMETMMPPKGIQLRSLQLAMLSRIGHKMSTDPEIGRLLDAITRNPNYDQLNTLQKRNVYLVSKHYAEQTKLPEELVAETAKQQAIAIDTWKKAKVAKDYSIFRPELEKMLELRKKAAEILMNVKNTITPYDALIDIFEPNMTSEVISKTFTQMKQGLVSLTEKCTSAPKQPDTSTLKLRVPIDTQRNIAGSLAEIVGYDAKSDNARGRVDEAEHPFTTGYYDDVRITTHYYPNNFASSVFSVLHEAGHAIYEQNLNREWIYQAVGTACSAGFHESQSRFYENIIGRSREFWEYFLPVLQKLTGNLRVDLDKFIHAVNKVEPSKIRVEADEVTYCLHIIIRFEIERDLFAGKITVAELPQVWNQSYMENLKVNIEDDSEGVMQDIHWSSGAFGYFPSYALGNIYSGQILAATAKNLPHWKSMISAGNLQEIGEWLKRNVHAHGNMKDPGDLIREITGEQLTVTPYIDYLNNKYSELYGF